MEEPRSANRARSDAPSHEPPARLDRPPSLRVAHIIKATGLAGAERHLLVLLQGLRGRGVDTRLIILVEPRRQPTEFYAAAVARGIPTIRCPIVGDADPSLWIRLARHLRRMRPDLIHTHLFHADLHGSLAARRAGIGRIVSTRHNDDAFRKRRIWRWIHRRSWSHVSFGIAVSEAVADFSRRVEGAPAERLFTVRHGLEVADHRAERATVRTELGFAENDLVVGLVGRLTRQKGFDLGLEVAGRLAREIPSLRIVVIGDGPRRGALQRQRNALGVGERVQFLGWRQDAVRCMAGMDVLLIPSRWEGFGLVVLEALSQQLLVVAAPVGAIAEILTDGVTGLIASANTPDALYEKLRVGVIDPESRARLAKSGHEHGRAHFTAARMVEETLAVYARLGLETEAPS